MVAVDDQQLTRFNPNHTNWIKVYTLLKIKENDVNTSLSKQYAREALSTFVEILGIIQRNYIKIKNIPIICESFEENKVWL